MFMKLYVIVRVFVSFELPIDNLTKTSTELLAKPHPEGYAWDDLLNLIPATPIDRSPNVIILNFCYAYLAP